MVKRKASEGDIPVELLKKKKVSVGDDDFKGGLDLTKADTLIDSLLGSKKENFFGKYWEKQPYSLKRNDSNFYGNLFTLSTLKEILKNNELDFQSDVNVCRYVKGEKELLNEVGQITDKDVDRLIKEKQATFQFHHPQRYVNFLWNILEKMETFFGSLVGSNIYITPKDSQGLAPHCDDVEIFVLQLEGKKEWKLYKPMVELSRDYTQDLSQDDIGEPILEVTLEAGDFLYFPRGTIHQCKAVGDTHSTHISISTYQQNTWGDFLNHAVTQAIENALEDDVKIRSGLPLNYVSYLGTARNMDSYVVSDDDTNKEKLSNEDDPKVKDFKKTVKDYLSKLVDHIDVNTAADAMSADFMVSRLPPYGHAEKEDDVDLITPTLDDEIKMRYPEHVRVEYCDDDENNVIDEDDEDDDDDDDDDEEGEEMEQEEKPTKAKDGAKGMSPKKVKKTLKSNDDAEDDDDEEYLDNADMNPHIKILHSLNNDRFSHMGGSNVFEESVGCLKMNVHFAKAAIQLLNSKHHITVKDLHLDDDSDKLTLAATLFADGLIEVKQKE